MHSFAPISARKRHRHVVVAPVFALVFLMTLQLGAGSAMTGSIIALPSGLTALDGGVADGEIHDNVLTGDSALVLAEAPVTITWKNARITGWAGAFHLTAGDHLTVSAITTPVLVQVAPRSAMLVPVGMQWRLPDALPSVETSDITTWLTARTLLPLPEAFLIEKIKAADALKDDLPQKKKPHAITPLDEFFQLPAARERAEASLHQNALDPLEAALRAGDAPAAQALIATSEVMEALASAHDRIPHLLGIAALHDVPVQTTLMPLLQADEALWLVASAHPDLEGAHWLLTEPGDESNEASFLRLWTLPIADNGADAFAPTSVSAWGVALNARLFGQAEPAAEAKLFLKVIDAIVQNHRAEDHPERAERYAQTTYEALLPFEMLFTDEEKAALNGLQQSDAYLLAVPEPTSASSASVASAQSSSSAASILHPDEVTARTRAAMSAVGIMFTKDTFVDPEGNSARVRNAVMATPTGDRYYDFMYDVLKNEVGSIVDDGTTYPYSLPLDRFVEWVKKGE